MFFGGLLPAPQLQTRMVAWTFFGQTSCSMQHRSDKQNKKICSYIIFALSFVLIDCFYNVHLISNSNSVYKTHIEQHRMIKCGCWKYMFAVSCWNFVLLKEFIFSEFFFLQTFSKLDCNECCNSVVQSKICDHQCENVNVFKTCSHMEILSFVTNKYSCFQIFLPPNYLLFSNGNFWWFCSHVT
jgi:hypothetical protein